MDLTKESIESEAFYQDTRNNSIEVDKSKDKGKQQWMSALQKQEYKEDETDYKVESLIPFNDNKI